MSATPKRSDRYRSFIDTPQSNKRAISLDSDNEDEPSTTHSSSPSRRKSRRLSSATTPSTPTRSRISHAFTPSRQLATPPASPSKSPYAIAKSLFQRSANTLGVIGRDEERKTLGEFLSRKNGALYISGLPGTGKSALVSETLKSLGSDDRVAFINCMGVSRPDDVFEHILNGLTKGQSDIEDLDPVEALQSLLFDTDSEEEERSIVVLDELDHIMTKDQQILFKLFQWASSPQSNLVLVGIANALDLTDRFLPRLRANSITPDVLRFSPYTAAQITEIIQKKLKSLNEDEHTSEIPLMHPAAIQLCARKTAANTGDIRKAFDICRRAIEMVEEQTRRAMSSCSDESKRRLLSSSSACAPGGPENSIGQAPKCTVMHVSKICSSAFGGSAVSRIKGLNVHQKAVLCVLLSASRTMTSQQVTTATMLFERFNEVSSRDSLLGTVQFNEFVQLLSALESSGLVTLSGAKESGQRRVTASVQKLDLMAGINDIDFLKKFIKS